jgi:hypothetical protein
MRVMMVVMMMSQTVHEVKITKTANIVKTNFRKGRLISRLSPKAPK